MKTVKKYITRSLFYLLFPLIVYAQEDNNKDNHNKTDVIFDYWAPENHKELENYLTNYKNFKAEKYYMTIESNGTTFETDEEGYLAILSDWNADLADAMAKEDGCDMTENHWEVVKFLREYYKEYQIAPAVRVLTKGIGKRLGKEKGNSKYLYELFPDGPAKQACKYAGLPKPTGCV